jgi:UDP-N-acetylmuramate dehydrogenase
MEQDKDVPLARFTTLKVGGTAQRLCVPESAKELVQLLGDLSKSNEPWNVIGGGSNLLISSKGVEGTVIRLTGLNQLSNPKADVVEAGSGVRLPHLARYAAELELSGLEFLVGIPGTVGGGIFMNAGAHGSCIAEVLESAQVYDIEDAQVKTMDLEQLKFAYRKSILQNGKYVALGARFRLNKVPIDQIKSKMQHNEDYRWRTQPLGFPNAGSTFKNPEPERGAGLLLDQAGAKELRQGNAAVSAVHANFVVNLGGASSDEVIELLKRMQECVQTKFGLLLKPEWKYLGRFAEEELQVWNVK